MDEAEIVCDDFNEAILKGDYNKAQLLINQLWLDTMIFCVKKQNPELSELNYIKAAVDTGKGKYLIALIHVDGEKVNLKELV